MNPDTQKTSSPLAFPSRRAEVDAVRPLSRRPVARASVQAKQPGRDYRSKYARSEGSAQGFSPDIQGIRHSGSESSSTSFQENGTAVRKSVLRKRSLRMPALIALGSIALLLALLRADLLPLIHVSSEALIWACIFSTLALLGYLFFLLCRGLRALYKRAYRLPLLIFLFLFSAFAASYLSINVLSQSFDPTIDEVLASLPPPGRKVIFARQREGYEAVDLPLDRRVAAEEIADSGARPAIIAVEDERLESRFGPIDLEALLRGAVKTFVMRSRREGGSTILIQTAKNMLRAKRVLKQSSDSNSSKTVDERQDRKESLSRALLRKCAELLLSLRLAQRFPTANEQLALYVSLAPMGGSTSDGKDRTFGYLAADLFGVMDLRELKTTDVDDVLTCAMLSGMFKAPTRYHPRLHPQDALQRRNIALSQMAKSGGLPQDLSTLQAQPIHLRNVSTGKNRDFYYSTASFRGAL